MVKSCFSLAHSHATAHKMNICEILTKIYQLTNEMLSATKRRSNNCSAYERVSSKYESREELLLGGEALREQKFYFERT